MLASLTWVCRLAAAVTASVMIGVTAVTASLTRGIVVAFSTILRWIPSSAWASTGRGTDSISTGGIFIEVKMKDAIQMTKEFFYELWH